MQTDPLAFLRKANVILLPEIDRQNYKEYIPETEYEKFITTTGHTLRLTYVLGKYSLSIVDGDVTNPIVKFRIVLTYKQTLEIHRIAKSFVTEHNIGEFTLEETAIHLTKREEDIVRENNEDVVHHFPTINEIV